MSKILGIALASTLALVSIPASAAPADKGTAVYNNDGRVIGQDPDAFIRNMLLREEPSKHGE
ncbi:MAG TPA: hypothetical protein VIJ17_05330 [Pseudolabrys sp.]|jgi:hypothetical protein